MENLDLNKYQLAWKKEKSFQAEKLSEIEIQNFMKSASKIVGHYKRSLLFDIGFKGILLISFLVLIFLLKNQSNAIITNSFIVCITIIGIIWQTKVYKRVDKICVTKEHLKDLLRAYIDFYMLHICYVLQTGHEGSISRDRFYKTVERVTEKPFEKWQMTN